MVGSGHVDKGAIYSIAGDSKWAGSAGFEVRLLSSCPSCTRESSRLRPGTDVMDKEAELTMR